MECKSISAAIGGATETHTHLHSHTQTCEKLVSQNLLYLFRPPGTHRKPVVRGLTYPGARITLSVRVVRSGCSPDVPGGGLTSTYPIGLV